MKKYYYTIGEVSNLLDIKQYVLRYWEKEFSQVHPQKRFGRNRKYSPDDIETLKKIKHMLYTQKFTIAGCKKKLREMKNAPNQIELDFSVSKKEVKKKLKDDLLEVKKILLSK